MWKTIIGISILLTTVSTTGFAEPFSLKGANLGMELKTLHSLPYPAIGQYKEKGGYFEEQEHVFLWCEGDESGRGGVSLDELYKSSHRRGVTTCRHVIQRYGKSRFTLGKSWRTFAAPIPFAGLPPEALDHVLYRFVQDNNKQRLAEIDIRMYSLIFETAVASMRSHYGEPHSVTQIPFQNGLGAQVIGRRVVWMNGDSAIIFDQYDGDRRYSALRFVHIELKERWSQIASRMPVPGANDF